MVDSKWAEWFLGKTFTTDWTSAHFETWSEVLPFRKEAPLRILEIGSWEGRSAIFWLRFFPQSHLVCIDPFTGCADQEATGSAADEIEERFDANLSSFGARVEKIKSRSTPALDILYATNRKFDLIYIDGHHIRDEIMLDSFMSWRLLAPNGVIVWDDYLYDAGHIAPAQRPKETIDAFLRLYAPELAALHMGYQVIALKSASKAVAVTVAVPSL